MSHPVGACLLYFGIDSAGLHRQQHNKHQRGQSLKEKRRKERLTPAGRYEGMLDTIVQLFRVYASGLIRLVHAI
jgi:hypothetical protein